MAISEKIVVLDACVLYPAPLRDFLLHIAAVDVYQPRWSAMIQDEWLRNLILNRQDLSKEKLIKTVNAMNQAFPSANVEGFEVFIETVQLSDENDRHVVAAAIKSQATRIITFNLKDFPNEVLQNWNIYALGPDKFILELLENHTEDIIKALQNQTSLLKNPPLTLLQVCERLEVCGLRESITLLKKLLALDR